MPFSEQEKKVWDLLSDLTREFMKLEQTHPSHLKDMVDAIHVGQNILSNRAMQKLYPELYATYKQRQGGWSLQMVNKDVQEEE